MNRFFDWLCESFSASSQVDPWSTATVWLEDDVLKGSHADGTFEVPLREVTNFHERAETWGIEHRDTCYSFPVTIIKNAPALLEILRSRVPPQETKPVPLKYRCMTLRTLLEDPIEELASPERQHKDWPSPFTYSSFDTVSEALLDDVNMGDDEAFDLYTVQTRKALEACNAVARLVLALYRKLRDAKDAQYLAHPDWPQIVAAAQVALEALREEEDLPLAEALTPVSDPTMRRQVRDVFERWERLSEEDLHPSEEEVALLLSIEEPLNWLGRIFAHDAEAYGVWRVQHDLPVQQGQDTGRLHAHAQVLSERMAHADRLLERNDDAATPLSEP